MSIQLPDFLEKKLSEQYESSVIGRIKEGYTKKRLVTFRANTLKTTAEQIAKQLDEAGIRYEKPEWYDDAFILTDEREDALRKLDIYENGEIYLQNLSSMVPPLLLDPREDECILDMAAAPGGKTTQMAALSNGRAQITACEKNKIRAERLKYNLTKQGASRITVMTEDARKLDPLFSFDKILLDAPCSGSGTLLFYEGESNKDSASFSKELIDRSVKTQEAMLRKALSLLKPGHEMIYSTCSILEEENELLVNRVLSKAKAKLVPIDHPLMSDAPLLKTKLEGTCLICPTELYEGFFAAKIRKL